MALLIHALTALKLLVFADALFSWVLKPSQFPRSLTKPLLDPVYAPLRRALQPFTGSVDLSPLVVLACLFGLQALLERGRKGDSG